MYQTQEIQKRQKHKTTNIKQQTINKQRKHVQNKQQK